MDSITLALHKLIPEEYDKTEQGYSGGQNGKIWLYSFHYINMAEVMAGMFSPFLETVVHDLSNRENSIIAIYNGNVKGKEVGDPVANVVTKLIEGNAPDIVTGYENEVPYVKNLKSSYVYIRYLSGKLIGVLGINMNIEDF